MTNLTADTDRLQLWLWMVIAGLGIGPSFAVFTLIVQNSVVPRLIGVATASLTFFQQIGGTVGLTIAGTLFADRFVAELPKQMAAAGADPLVVQAFGAAGGAAGNALGQLTGTGDLGQQILAGTPEPFRPLVQGQPRRDRDRHPRRVRPRDGVGLLGRRRGGRDRGRVLPVPAGAANGRGSRSAAEAESAAEAPGRSPRRAAS